MNGCQCIAINLSQQTRGVVVLYAHASLWPAMPWCRSHYGLCCDSASGNRFSHAESTVNNQTVGSVLHVTMDEISSYVD